MGALLAVGAALGVYFGVTQPATERTIAEIGASQARATERADGLAR